MGEICWEKVSEFNSNTPRSEPTNAKANKVTSFPGDKVSKADGGERDHDEVDGLQRAPALDVLENDGGQGHEDEAPEEDEEQGGDDANLRLADFPLLWRDKGIC